MSSEILCQSCNKNEADIASLCGINLRGSQKPDNFGPAGAESRGADGAGFEAPLAGARLSVLESADGATGLKPRSSGFDSAGG